MFTTSFMVKASLSKKEKEEMAMKHWRRNFGTCNLEVNVRETVGDVTKVEVTCTVEGHDHAETIE